MVVATVRDERLQLSMVSLEEIDSTGTLGDLLEVGGRMGNGLFLKNHHS